MNIEERISPIGKLMLGVGLASICLSSIICLIKAETRRQKELAAEIQKLSPQLPFLYKTKTYYQNEPQYRPLQDKINNFTLHPYRKNN